MVFTAVVSISPTNQSDPASYLFVVLNHKPVETDIAGEQPFSPSASSAHLHSLYVFEAFRCDYCLKEP